MQNPFGNLYSRYRAIYRYPDGVVPNTLAITYAVLGYICALVMLLLGGWYLLAGILLLSHSLVIAAYLLHECTHGSLFAVPVKGGRDYHSRLARLLSWLTGACYGDLEKIREKHLRHHFERADISSLDYRKLLDRKPLLKKVVELGQRCFLPAVELLMHGLVMIRPWTDKDCAHLRRSVAMVFAVRLGFFAGLTVVGGWPALLGYALAYLIFLTVLNFMDAFQHSYLLLVGLDQDRSQSPTRDQGKFPRGYFDRDYEDAHTWSNLLSHRWPVVNLLVLNFPYHSVHHQHPMEPWYRLPELHRRLLSEGGRGIQTLTLWFQLKHYVRYRSARVMAPASDHLGDTNVGAAGVSFLTPL